MRTKRGTPHVVALWGLSSDNTGTLPDELLLRIFGFVDRPTLAGSCALVSRRWHRLAMDAENWKSIDLPAVQLSPSRIFEPKFSLLRHLNVAGLDIEDDFIDRLTRTAHQLERLNISNCSKLTDEAFRRLGEGSPHLKHLDFSNYFVRPGITDRALKHLSSLPSLSTVRLAWSRRSFSRAAVEDFLSETSKPCDHQTNLRLLEIDLRYCVGIDDGFVSTQKIRLKDRCPRIIH